MNSAARSAEEIGKEICMYANDVETHPKTNCELCNRIIRAILAQAQVIAKMREALKGLLDADEKDLTGYRNGTEEDKKNCELFTAVPIAIKALALPESAAEKRVKQMISALEFYRDDDYRKGLPSLAKEVLAAWEGEK